MHKNIKIEKLISSCGFCSRREATKLIKTGRIKVNDEIIINVASRVDISSKIFLDDRRIKPLSIIKLWKYYKPLGLICSRKDPSNHNTIFENIATKYNISEYIISIGRLDINSEGLLLLTNNGEFARKMELPSNSIIRIYKIRAYGRLDKFFLFSQEQIKKILGYNFFDFRLIKHNIKSKNHWFQISLTEGKNREVRNIFKFLDMQVNKLVRIQYGKYKLGSMKPGELIESRDGKRNF